jgi:hypothetical protein
MKPETLRSHVAPELSVTEDTQGPADLLLTSWKGVCHLVLGERRYGPYRTKENAYQGLSYGIHFLIARRSPMTFLHAGAVELDGGAMVFPGRGRWGKSTLVASLVEEGCGYLSDEFAVVSPEGTVFPFSKPIRLKGTSSGTTYVRPAGAGAPGGLPCVALFLTRFEAGSAWSPQPLTSNLAVLRTLPAALKHRDAHENVRVALHAMLKDAACYEGVRGNGAPTVAAIRELCGAEDFSMKASS